MVLFAAWVWFVYVLSIFKMYIIINKWYFSVHHPDQHLIFDIKPRIELSRPNLFDFDVQLLAIG